MAKLGNFTVNANAIEAGAWVSPGPEFDDLEIKTRGYTDAYTDAREAKLRRLAVTYSGDVGRIPVRKRTDAVVDLLIQHCLLDVRGLVDAEGKPIEFPAFCDLIREPGYAPLLTAAFAAAAQVGNMKAAELEEAAKN